MLFIAQFIDSKTRRLDATFGAAIRNDAQMGVRAAGVFVEQTETCVLAMRAGTGTGKEKVA